MRVLECFAEETPPGACVRVTQCEKSEVRRENEDTIRRDGVKPVQDQD